MKNRFMKFMVLIISLSMVISGCTAPTSNKEVVQEVEKKLVEVEEVQGIFKNLYVDLLKVNPLEVDDYTSLDDYAIEGKVEKEIVAFTEQKKRLADIVDGYTKKLSTITVEDEFYQQQIEVALYDLAIMKEKSNYALEFLVFNEIADQLKSVQEFLKEGIVIETEDDLKVYIKHVKAAAVFMKDFAEQLALADEKGLKTNHFATREEKKLLKFTAVGSDSNRLFQIFKQASSNLSLDEEQLKAYEDEIRTIVFDEFVPEANKIVTLIGKIYVPAEQKVGLSFFEQGEDMYQVEIKRHTTTDMTADEVYELGLKEVARLQEQLDKTLVEYGLTEGSVKERINTLRETDEDYIEEEAKERYYQTRDEVLAFLPNIFLASELPKHEVVIDKSDAGNYYRSPNENDLDSKGTYFLAMSDVHNDFEVNTLAYHEMIPGHHLERSNEVALDLPAFREFDHFTAYIEGWALYSEHMMDEEFGKGPKYHIGYLDSQLFRAVRLVVDTGLHHKAWTRREAIDYMMENAYFSEGAAEAEIDRYIGWPGQALSYKIGQLEILALRQEVMDAKKDKFDIKEFHHDILKNGSLPLKLLRSNIEKTLE